MSWSHVTARPCTVAVTFIARWSQHSLHTKMQPALNPSQSGRLGAALLWWIARDGGRTCRPETTAGNTHPGGRTQALPPLLRR